MKKSEKRYVRAVELERDRALEKVKELEARLEERTAYAFSLCGKPTPEQVKERASKLKPDPQPLPPRASLRNVRKSLITEAVGKIMDRGTVEPDPATDAMKVRAEEFVKSNGGVS